MDTEWEVCTELYRMLDELKNSSPRKLRLFAVACCRRIAPLPLSPPTQHLLDVSERYADGLVSEHGLARARFEARSVLQHGDDTHDAVTNASSTSAWGAAVAVAESAARAAGWASTTGNVDAVIRAETIAECEVLREIFGNPSCSLPTRPEAIAPLAQEIYEGKADLIPLLGEWLQEHGYWDIGAHCLDPAIKHYKGCWVVDWVLGKG
jgi:hypothetical protein